MDKPVMLWLGERAEDGRAVTMHSIPMGSMAAAKDAVRVFDREEYLTDFTSRGEGPWWELTRKV